MRLTKELLEKIHAIDQELLDEFVRVCEENNLKYYLDAGTLLGAIRHQGPIPWDDDLDVVMPRADFEKFREIMLARPEGELYHIHSNENDPNYPNRYLKLLKRGTVFTCKKYLDLKIKYMEIWIDIFPLDDAPDKIDWRFRIYCWFMRKVTNACYIKPRSRSSLSLKQKIERIMLVPFSLQQLVSLDRKLMRKYERHGRSQIVNWASKYDYAKITMPKSWYEPNAQVAFRGKYYSVPGKWDKVLTQMYGDYMMPPPEEERRGHNIIDLKL